MAQLKLTLYENAIDFAEDAISNALIAEERPDRWKFAVFSLVQAIELSLKEALRLQHPLLIYTNIDKPENTVGITLATSRLQRLSDFDLTAEEKHALRSASEFRNRIVHNEADTTTEHLKLAFARLLGFLNDFHRKHLQEPLQDSVNPDLWRQGALIKDYGEELFKRAKTRMEEDELDDPQLSITCRKCGWDTLSPFGNHSNRCYVCGSTEHLIVCDRCQKIMFFGEHEETRTKEYCQSCFEYLSDDYWHDLMKENN